MAVIAVEDPAGARRLRSRPDLAGRFEADKAWAAERLRSKGSVEPMFVVHCRDGRVIPVMQAAAGDDARDATYEMVRLMCLAEDAVALSSMGEAWMVINPPHPEIRPSKSDLRREVLVVMLRGRVPDTGEPFTDVSVLGIERGPDGAVSGLAEMPELAEWMRGDREHGGAIADLFPLEPASGAVRRKARADADRIRKRAKRGKPAKPH